MTALLAADKMTVGAHAFIDVFIADIGFFIADTGTVKRLVQTEIGHNGRDDSIIGELITILHVFSADIEDEITVDYAPRFVNCDAAVGVAIESKADIEIIGNDEIAQILYMRRAAVIVDVEPVRSAAEDVGLGAERFEYALCNLPGAAVGAVKADAHTLVGMRRKAYEIADIAVAACGIVDSAPDIAAHRIGSLGNQAVKIFFNLINNIGLHLFA